MAFPGFPGGAGGAPFDFSALQQALSVSAILSTFFAQSRIVGCAKPLSPLCPQDPSIKQMAEQIANDPSFQGLQQQLQTSMAGLMGQPGTEEPAVPDPSNFDPAKYMQAMSGMFQNEGFMKMAEQLGQAIIQV